jgi:hypothetical protein
MSVSKQGNIVDMKHTMAWHAELQRCHYAGWDEVSFELREREKRDDDVPQNASSWNKASWAQSMLLAAVVVGAVGNWLLMGVASCRDTFRFEGDVQKRTEPCY